LGLERFRPTDESVGRFIEEVRLYEQKVRRFQYHVTDDDLELALKSIPVEATGVSTDPFEVSNFRDVPGIRTNRLRGGALIVVVDGIIGRAMKLLGICEKLGLEGWDWLSNLGHHDNEVDKPTASFMEEIIVGRPVFSFLNRYGGFRLRYGRARTTGLAAVGIHPATMIILNKFLCTGVQLRIELPGKSAVITPVDSIEPPIVKLNDGTVLRIETENEANRLFDKVDSILFLGDVLINAGDFIQNNKSLLKAGYDETQWHYDLNKILKKEGLKSISEKMSLSQESIKEFSEQIRNVPTPEEAIVLAKAGIPLHPRYTYLWNSVTKESIKQLRNVLADSWFDGKTHNFELNKEEKATLENLLVPHKVIGGKVNLDEVALVLESCLALNKNAVKDTWKTPLEMIRNISGLEIRDKAPIHVGARMGRPEKAKERKMSPYVHGLFPVGNAGGPQRDILKTQKGRKTSVQIVNRYCPQCEAMCFGVICPICGEETIIQKTCPRCNRTFDIDYCPVCKTETVSSHTANLELRTLFEMAWKRVGGQRPNRFKCVRGLMNKNRTPEPLEKGLLRARYDLSVFKDGTLRYDLTDVPLTHFTPREVGVTVNRLKELGYQFDKDGEPLESSDQMLELRVQDVIIPEDCGDYLVKASKFIDELLEKFYEQESYYNIVNKDQVIGQLIHGLAPHTSATIIGRVIGYTRARVCYAHPLWHAAKRRNCDGDEDGIMLGLDPLLNFSKEFLPEQSGGLMDAPLYVIPTLNPSEVDKEAHNIDVDNIYSPAFYKLCENEGTPVEYAETVDTIGDRLGTERQFKNFGYTEECSSINLGSHLGAYNTLKTMLEKLESQLELSEKLRAVDADTVAQRVLTSHFMKDIVGNLRAFTRQRVRCMECNRKYRRPPLKGICTRCGGKLSQTVYKGGIEKYLSPAMDLVKRYALDDYYTDRLELVKDEIASLFQEEEDLEKSEEKQFSLTDFMRS
jgi:DNA polymerase II large subunit